MGAVNPTIKEEVLDLAKEVEAESTSEAQLGPLPIEPESAPIEPDATIKEPKDMTQAESAIETAQPLAAPKIRYLIQAARDKMATTNSEKNAKKIARRFVNEGYKRVEISTIYPFAVAKQGVEVERVWQQIAIYT